MCRIYGMDMCQNSRTGQDIYYKNVRSLKIHPIGWERDDKYHYQSIELQIKERDTYPELDKILDYYDNHTATEIVKHFNLPDTPMVRKWLGVCFPKGKQGRSVTAKGYKNAERRLKISTEGETVISLLRKYQITYTTAYRGLKTGFIHIKKEKIRKVPLVGWIGINHNLTKPQLKALIDANRKNGFTSEVNIVTMTSFIKRGWAEMVSVVKSNKRRRIIKLTDLGKKKRKELKTH